ncbi:MAG: hypothetical protein H6615_07800 [Ignavibacteria bacterium]|nr:hypothetical protein [Ignavibacteria bacterium]
MKKLNVYRILLLLLLGSNLLLLLNGNRNFYVNVEPFETTEAFISYLNNDTFKSKDLQSSAISTRKLVIPLSDTTWYVIDKNGIKYIYDVSQGHTPDSVFYIHRTNQKFSH